ncbi:MAG: SGNH/GDSL hydrolase family protein [Victivallales bacterium]|jgi:lysophospholipase L1-like esterase
MIEEVVNRFSKGELTRIMAFGSSNTERFAPFLNWFDWLDLCLRSKYGRNHVCINTGICGDTARGLLNRFDKYVVPCNPDVIFITIGGNDSAPANGVSDKEFASNLNKLIERVRNLPNPCIPILQTYYSADIQRLIATEGEERAEKFLRFMEIVREVSRESGCALIDNLIKWEILRKKEVEIYRSLLIDPFHLNADGNMVMGLEVSKCFGIPVPPADIQIPDRILGILDVMNKA